VASGHISTAGRQGRARLIDLEALQAYQQERRAEPPRRGRPPTKPGSFLDALEQYREAMQRFYAADYRRRIADLCRAYREAEPTISELELWLQTGDPSEGRIAIIDPLRAALNEAAKVWMSSPGDAEMRFVRVRRLAGWTWPAIAKEFGKSERWAQILDRRWRETFGAVITDIHKGEQQ